MILNSLNNQFVIRFGPEFFYPSIRERWKPVVERLKLPYMSLEDFMNASVQSVSFPSMDLPIQEQQQGQFRIAYRGGKELEPVFEKNLTVTFKLSEGFFTYWIMFEQLESYLEYRDSEPFWPPMYVSFLDHQGREIIAFSFEKIVPRGMSQFEISYSQTAAEFNTFNVNLRYNRFNIDRRIGNNPR